MPRIRVIDEEDADEKLKAAYGKIKGTRGKVANILKIHSLKPETMLAHEELYLTLLFRNSGLSREEREIIATVVSAANNCEYCIQHHAEALNVYWKDRARVDLLIRDVCAVDLPARTRAMVAYAVNLTQRSSGMREQDVEDLRQAGFSDEDILSINRIASYFNFVNRIALGLGVEFSEEEVKGYNY
jgi:uncharacterized peroxidase-related enzyme